MAHSLLRRQLRAQEREGMGSVDLSKMLRSSHDCSSNSVKHSTSETRRWKSSKSPPILRRPSKIKFHFPTPSPASSQPHHLTHETLFTYTLPTIDYPHPGSFLSPDQRPYTSANSHTGYSTLIKPRTSNQHHRRHSYQTPERQNKTLTTIGIEIREPRNQWSSPQVLVPKLWKALKGRKSIKKRGMVRDLEGILVGGTANFHR